MPALGWAAITAAAVAALTFVIPKIDGWFYIGPGRTVKRDCPRCHGRGGSWQIRRDTVIH